MNGNKSIFTDLTETLFYFEIIPSCGGDMKTKTIHLYLKKLEDALGEVGIGDVARVLKGIQDAIYHLGEYKFSKERIDNLPSLAMAAIAAAILFEPRSITVTNLLTLTYSTPGE